MYFELSGFRMLQAPYAPTPMRPPRCCQHDALEEDGEDGEEGGGIGNNKGVIGHGILAGTYLAENCDLLN